MAIFSKEKRVGYFIHGERNIIFTYSVMLECLTDISYENNVL